MKKILLFLSVAILMVATSCNPNPKTEGSGGTDSGVAENFPVAADGDMPSAIFDEIKFITNVDPSSLSSYSDQFKFGPTNMTATFSFANKTEEIVLTMTNKILSDGNYFKAESSYVLPDGQTASSIHERSSASSEGINTYVVNNVKFDNAEEYQQFFNDNRIEDLLKSSSPHSRSTTGAITGSLSAFPISETNYDIGFEADFSGNKTYEKMTFNPAYNETYTVIEIWNETKIINGNFVMTSATVRLTETDGTVSTYALTENQLNRFNAD